MGLGSKLSGLGYPASEALGFSTATIPALLELSSSIPSEVSTLEIFLEKSFAPSSLEAAIVSSTTATLQVRRSRLVHCRQGLGWFRWGLLHGFSIVFFRCPFRGGRAGC
jgi:hypothetical protein